MKYGDLNELISETSDYPGSIGDSAHNTARLVLLKYHLGISTEMHWQALINFRSPSGYLRHWKAPIGWRENDSTTDMLCPLYLAYKICQPGLAKEMKARIKDGWMSGNGNLISPNFYAILNENQWLINQTLWAQAMIFKLPYRWSDSKKWFEKSSGSSADYLNFIHTAALAYPWVRYLVSKKVLKTKVREYFKPEPASELMTEIINLYDQFIDQYFTKE